MSENKLNPAKIQALIANYEYVYSQTAPTLTICVLTLVNGTTVVGTSNVIDPANYDAELGQQTAYSNAQNKIWELEGYAMKRDMAE